MTRDLEDANPLADVDLQAWVPPAPPADQVDAILVRVTTGETAAALEPLRPASPRRPRRTGWIAAAVVLVAAAAAVFLALGGDRAPASGIGPAPAPDRVPGASVPRPAPAPRGRPGATVPRPPPLPPSPSPSPSPSPTTNVAPSALELLRIAGDMQISPDDATTALIAGSGKTKVVASFKLCVDTTGAVSQVTMLKSSGFAGYDDKLTRTMQGSWKYRPYLVNGVATPVCTAATFIYSQKSPSPP